MSNLLRSLLLTTVLSFVTPVVLIGCFLAILSGISYIPGIEIIGDLGVNAITNFLSVFGNGCPLEGMLIIGCTCSTVGGAFDMFNFYFYQGVKGH